MPSTTVHIPDALLARVDALAKARGVSRNRFIVGALERVLDAELSWPPEFLEQLRTPVRPSDVEAIDRMLGDVVQRRTSKPSPEL